MSSLPITAPISAQISARARAHGPVVGHAPSARTRRTRAIYAGAVLALPLAGTLFALARALLRGVSGLELVALLSTYTATLLGITLGYHRGGSHRAFRAHPALESLLLALGSMAAQGPVLQWAADHRRHHHLSDRSGDPHSPHRDGTLSLRGLWHAHLAWTLSGSLTNTLYYCRDLLRNPRVRFFSRSYWWWVLAGLIAPALLAYALERTPDALLSGLLWGGLVRVALTSHMAFAINSLAHAFGTRPFETTDRSRNLAWLALPTLGEAWHNNHHAHPGSAYFGLRPWQIDIGGWFVTLLAALGLLTRVRSIHGPAARVARNAS